VVEAPAGDVVYVVDEVKWRLVAQQV
jgi:hypothetical protein